MSIVTSSELLQNILVSINTALQEPGIHNDIRSSLIDQYEKIVSFIREGYQYSDEDLEDLPTTIRAEVHAQLNEEISTFQTVSQGLTQSFNEELIQLQVLPEAIRTETNTKLDEELLTFQSNFEDTVLEPIVAMLGMNSNIYYSLIDAEIKNIGEN